jgi:predicted ArsR family transcriptional regulator
VKRNEVQSAIEAFIQSNSGEFTAQEVLDDMKLPFSVVTVRHHLDNLVMKDKIRSNVSSRPAADGRNHKAVVYFK